MGVTPHTVGCEVCGVSVNMPPSRLKKGCRPRCDEHRRKLNGPIDVECEICGAAVAILESRLRLGDRKRCDQHRGVTTPNIVPCEVCGVDVRQAKCRSARGEKARCPDHKRRPHIATCVVCGAEMRARPGEKKPRCTEHKKKIVGSMTVQCEVCGVDVRMINSHLEARNRPRCKNHRQKRTGAILNGQWLSTGQIAEIANCSTATVRRRIASGVDPFGGKLGVAL